MFEESERDVTARAVYDNKTTTKLICNFYFFEQIKEQKTNKKLTIH